MSIEMTKCRRCGELKPPQFRYCEPCRDEMKGYFPLVKGK